MTLTAPLFLLRLRQSESSFPPVRPYDVRLNLI
jgi:hypothetical protein